MSNLPSSSVFFSSNACKVDDCEMHHCVLCGCHMLFWSTGPCNGPKVCESCEQTASQTHDMTPADRERYRKAINPLGL